MAIKSSSLYDIIQKGIKFIVYMAEDSLLPSGGWEQQDNQLFSHVI